MTLIDALGLITIILFIAYALFNKGEIKKKESIHKPFKMNNYERND